MSEAVLTNELRVSSIADAALKASASLWFLVAVAGQWIFVYYVVVAYGAPAMQGNLAAWNQILPHGYVAGDAAGNAAVAAHIVLAVLIMAGGPLQLAPQVRAKFPVFHRWNGRVYLSAVLVSSVVGLYMLWTRGTVGGASLQIGLSLDAVLVIAFSALALRYAIARDFRAHRRWALRLFMAASAVWFFRIGLMGWIAANQAPVGFDPQTFRGPFLSFLAFAQYLLPLAILEIYLCVRDGAGPAGRLAMACGLLAVTAATGFGAVAAATGLWLPRI